MQSTKRTINPTLIEERLWRQFRRFYQEGSISPDDIGEAANHGCLVEYQICSSDDYERRLSFAMRCGSNKAKDTIRKTLRERAKQNRWAKAVLERPWHFGYEDEVEFELAIQFLEEKERELARMYFRDQLAVTDIAAELELSRQSVHVMLKKVREKLKAQLE